MVRHAIHIALILVVGLGIKPGSSSASTPPAPMSRNDIAPQVIEGMDVAVVELAFVAQYNNAYRDVGALGLSFVPVLQAYRDDLGFRVSPEGFAANVAEKDRLLAGLRAEHPQGLSALPKEAGAVLRRYPKEALSPFFGVFANAIAATCVSTEAPQNEDIVRRIVASRAPEAMHYHLLDWVTQLHATMCIGGKTHEAASASLVARTQKSLAALKPVDRIFALLSLYRAGVKSPVSRADLELLVKQDPVENEWEGARSDVFGRRDAVLAASYVLMRVLAEQHPGTLEEGVAAAVAQLYAKNMIRENTPLLDATSKLKPKPPNPNEWDPKVHRYFKLLTQVKVLADSDPRRLGPVSCGCTDQEPQDGGAK